MSVIKSLDRKNFRNLYVENNFPLEMVHQQTSQEGRTGSGLIVFLDKETQAKEVE